VPNDPSPPSAPSSGGFAGLLTLLSDVSAELKAVERAAAEPSTPVAPRPQPVSIAPEKGPVPSPTRATPPRPRSWATSSAPGPGEVAALESLYRRLHILGALWIFIGVAFGGLAATLLWASSSAEGAEFVAACFGMGVSMAYVVLGVLTWRKHKMAPTGAWMLLFPGCFMGILFDSYLHMNNVLAILTLLLVIVAALQLGKDMRKLGNRVTGKRPASRA